MGVFNLSIGRDPGCRSYQGKGPSPLSFDGDGGLGLGQEGGCWVTSSNEGNAVLNCISKLPRTKDSGVRSQGNEAPLHHKTRLMFHLQDDILEARHNSLKSAFKEQVTLAYATDLWINEDLSTLNQRYDCSKRSIDTAEGTQTALMDQMSEFLECLRRLEESCAAKDERICVLEGKVEEGEQMLSQVVDVLELLSVKVCWCNDDVVIALGSGRREVSLELEYASEDEEEEFRMPPPDLMTLVIEGCILWGMFPFTISLMMVTDNIIDQGRPNSEGLGREFLQLRRKTHPFLGSSDVFCLCPWGTMRIEDDEDVPSSEGSSSDDSYVEALMENAQVGSSGPLVYWRLTTTCLGHTGSFSRGGSFGSNWGSSKILSHK